MNGWWPIRNGQTVHLSVVLAAAGRHTHAGNFYTCYLANVGTLVISKIAEHPGPTVKLVTENDRGPKSIYYLLKMLSNVPHVSMEVITNLREIGRCIY